MFFDVLPSFRSPETFGTSKLVPFDMSRRSVARAVFKIMWRTKHFLDFHHGQK